MKTKPLDLCEACREDIRKGDPITMLDGCTFHRRCYRAMKSGTMFVRPIAPQSPAVQCHLLAIVLIHGE